MLFNSWQFLIFFPTVAGIYFATPHRYRCWLLLTASYAFYMASVPAYGLLLFGSTALDYSMGLAMGRAPDGGRRKALLAASLVSNLGLLLTFKYFNFFAGSISTAVGALGWHVEPWQTDWVLPVGISFYTFQTLSYTIDVYRGHQRPERDFGRFALFVSFFPQLVAGPIERSTHFLPQLAERRDFDYHRVVSGLRLMAWGFFKKIVIADRLATLVNAVYDSPADLSGPHYALATLFFAYQIYCDFSGYTDIARGAAEILGFRLRPNFDRPYQAVTISDFWARWHMSLSTWFRDYLYIPLGGNRAGRRRTYINLAIVFVVSGLWHGARWNFVAWGALHATFLIVGKMTGEIRQRAAALTRIDRLPRLQTSLQQVTVFALVCFAWIFFRANSLGDAWYITCRLHTGWLDALDVSSLRMLRDQIGVQESYLIRCGVLILTLEAFQLLNWQQAWHRLASHRPWPVRWGYYAAVALAILNLAAPTSGSFIYFQF